MSAIHHPIRGVLFSNKGNQASMVLPTLLPTFICLHCKSMLQKWREEKPGYFRSRSNLELEQLKKFKDKRNIRLLCRKFGNSVIDFVMD